MSCPKTGNITHDTTVATAESTRQTAIKAASTQAAVTAADIAFYRSALASALANGIYPADFQMALAALGVKA